MSFLDEILNYKKAVSEILREQEKIEYEGAVLYLLDSNDFCKVYSLYENALAELKAEKIERFFGGISELKKKPDILFLIGSHDEKIALKEAKSEKPPVGGGLAPG